MTPATLNARLSSLLPLALALTGCTNDAAGGAPPGLNPVAPTYDSEPIEPTRKTVSENDREASPLVNLPRGAEQLARLCARGRSDRVARALCDNPQIDSITTLQAALGLRVTDADFDVADAEFALLGHSMSLVSRLVSAINPRALIFSPLVDSTPGAVILAFTRGETFVELAAQDSTTSRLTFYLLDFELECERRGTCTHADLLTPAIESDWRGFSLYDDDDLKNTTLDCLQCHQPNGPSTPPVLLMHEVLPPWTHWLTQSTVGGAVLLQDFLNAHGPDEGYAGIPARRILQVSPLDLNRYLLTQRYVDQPVDFPSAQIEAEVSMSAPEQPLVNLPSGKSATWQRLYDAAAAGLTIPPPYHDVKVTDPNKLAVATKSYQDFKAGKIEPDELADIRDVFLDEALPDMMFVPAKGLTGREILVQACSQCHNPRLDQTLSRANFDVLRLDAMSAEVKAAAIERLLLPESDIAHMPPARFRTLPPEAIELAVEELRR